MTAAPLDPIGVNRRLIVGDVHARARSTYAAWPMLRGAVGIAAMPDLVRLPRLVDLIGPVTPPWATVAATTALRAQLDQTQLLAPSIHAAFAETSTRHLIAPALAAMRGQSALAAGPMLATLPRVATGLSSAGVERITRGLVGLAESPPPALADDEADEVVALLERDDAAEQLVALEVLHYAVLDVVESEPVAELMEHVDPELFTETAQGDGAALNEDTGTALGALRRRMCAFSAGEVTTLVLAPTALAVTLTLDVFGVDISPLGQHLSLPVGLLAISSYAQTLNQAARRRQAGEQDDLRQGE